MKSFVSLITLIFVFNVPNTYASGIAEQQEVQSFINDMVDKHSFDRKWLIQLFKQADIKEKIIKTMERPAEKEMTWGRYRNIFIQEKRINDGVAFYKQHEDTLKKAEQKYGIPAEILLAIMGVETFYGQRTGGHKVIDALSTLAFGYPKRAKFFRKELEQLLLLVREESIDPFSVQGSYAGAIGLPQFMPSSYRQYAIDSDGDGHRDLQNSISDTIASIANYLKRHGWKKGESIIHLGKTSTTNDDYKQLLDKGLKPSIELETIKQSGITLKDAISPNETKVSLFRMEIKNKEEYWVGEHNFYVITRYNHSALYALAVYQLAEAIKAELKTT